MIEEIFVVKNNSGLHARPATEFSKKAREFRSEITIFRGERAADAKSMLGILTLSLNKGSEFSLVIRGEDEKEAMMAMRAFIDPLEADDL